MSRKPTTIRIIIGSNDDTTYLRKELLGMTEAIPTTELQEIIREELCKLYYTQGQFEPMAHTIRPLEKVTIHKNPITTLVTKIRRSLDRGIKQTIIIYNASSDTGPLLLTTSA